MDLETEDLEILLLLEAIHARYGCDLTEMFRDPSFYRAFRREVS
jgi:hypothetical protein